MEQCDRDVFNAIKDRIDFLTEGNTINSIKINETDVPVVFDAATFFA